MKMLCRIAAVNVLLLFTIAAHADEEEGFSGRAGLGYLATSGNSESESLNGNFDLGWNYAPWRHSLSGVLIRSSTSGATTAEAYGLTGQSKYDFSDTSYVFALVAYDSDKFSSVDQQIRATAGYGRRLINKDNHVLNAEIGAGFRQSDLRDGTSEDDVIYRLAGDYAWTISETSKFTQTLSIESGSSNTYSEAVSALNAKIKNDLALVLSFTIKNNSDVLPGLERTDTFTAISLEYSF